MRTFAIVLLLISLTAGSAFAQYQYGGVIGLYGESICYCDCNLNEVLNATNTVYVVHTMAAQANTAQFKIDNHWPAATVGPADWGSNLFLGDPYTGITVTYLGCQDLPYLLGTLSFVPTTPTPPCTAYLEVVADPAAASGRIEVVGCGLNVRIADGCRIVINVNPNDCPCTGGDPVAAEPSNWGRIKALYQ